MRKIERAENGGPELSPRDATDFRALAARANYMAQDRPDCAYIAKELCREFAVPTVNSYDRLVRLCRYLHGVPRLVYCYDWQPVPTSMAVYVDTDFAGCKATRRSTSGGVVMLGDHCLRHKSSTQTTVSLSSAGVPNDMRLFASLNEASLKAIGQVVDEGRMSIVHMRVLIDVIDPLGVEQRGTAFDAMDLIALFQQEFGQIGSVLAGDTGDESLACHGNYLGVESRLKADAFLLRETPTHFPA